MTHDSDVEGAGLRSAAARIIDVLVPPRRALLLRIIPTVLVIVAAKLAVEWLGWEFITISPLHTSIVAGAIFIVGLMLTGTMADYKESERLPTDTAAALEAIYREGAFVKARWPEFDLDRMVDILARVPHTLREDLIEGSGSTIDTVEALTESFLEMDRLGVPPNYIARLKEAQAQIVRNLMRAQYIQRIYFLPSAFTLVELILALLISLLMFTRVANTLTDAVLLGFISVSFPLHLAPAERSRFSVPSLRCRARRREPVSDRSHPRPDGAAHERSRRVETGPGECGPAGVLCRPGAPGAAQPAMTW